MFALLPQGQPDKRGSHNNVGAAASPRADGNAIGLWPASCDRHRMSAAFTFEAQCSGPRSPTHRRFWLADDARLLRNSNPLGQMRMPCGPGQHGA